MISNPLNFLKSPVAVVCHDAGAANLIIGWLRNAAPFDFRAYMQGPAFELWESAFPSSMVASIDDAFSGASQLLSGTGWSSLLEHEARMRARSLGLPIIAAVDHWVNYRERFVRNGVEVLPDELWVSDSLALAEASKCFPTMTLRQFPNMYLESQVKLIHELDVNRKICDVQRVLYALEPIRLCWSGGDSRYGEFQALDYFISKLESLGLSAKTQIRLRPHPSDPPNKYDLWLASRRNHYDVSLAPNEPLANAVSWADWVAGCESFVLIVGLAAGKKTVSTLPPWGNQCRLPHKHLVHLSRLS